MCPLLLHARECDDSDCRPIGLHVRYSAHARNTDSTDKSATPELDAEALAAARQTIRVREKVMMTLEQAFQEVFRGSETKLVPIMNHRAVHLKLIEWDQLQMKLESIEVRAPVMRRCERPFKLPQLHSGADAAREHRGAHASRAALCLHTHPSVAVLFIGCCKAAPRKGAQLVHA
jgi:hypothetical protein